MEWNEAYGVLTDYMGLPISRSEAQSLVECLQEHLKKSPEELSAIHREILRKFYPEMLEQCSASPSHFE